MLATYSLTYAIIYLVILILIGWYAAREGMKTPEDYFVAGRAIGGFLLLWGILAANLTAIAIIGHPGEIYRTGVSCFGWFAAGAFGTAPLVAYLIGTRYWLLGKAYKTVSPSEVLAIRYQSPSVAITYAILQVIWTLIYGVTSIIGTGIAMNVMTNQMIPYWAGVVIVLVVLSAYTLVAGLKGQIYNNLFQSFVFTTFIIAGFFILVDSLGGFQAVTSKLITQAPKLLSYAGFSTPKLFISWAVILLLFFTSAIHLLTRYMVGKTSESLKWFCGGYPLAILIIYAPLTMMGLWGVVEIHGLQGKEADNILPMLFAKFAHPAFAGMTLAVVLAFVMSSVDAMLLGVSALVTRDVFKRINPDIPPAREVLIGRVTMIIATLIVLVVSLYRPGTLFAIAALCFTGYAITAPAIWGAVLWKRTTAAGALASMIVPTVLLPFYYFTPYFKWSLFGFMPVIPLTVLSIVLLVVVSLVTPSPQREKNEQFFGVLQEMFGK